MTEVRATTSVFIKEVKFNWKINDFALLWKASNGISSPQFNIGDKKCSLRINEREHGPHLILKLDGVRQNLDDYHILYMNVDLGEDKIPMCGFLSIDTEGHKISGIFGNPPRQMLQTDTSFLFNKIQTSRIALNSINTYFCISRQATQVDIEVKLYFPSPISNTLSHEPEKDEGVAELIADMRALLNRSPENADFNIECGGKVFPCHEAILRARSTVLEAMFQNEMTEASARSLVLVDVGPNTVAAVLEYMYTGGITAEVDSMKELVYVADKYAMAGLLDLCFRKLPEIADDMIVDFLFMADKHNLVEYKKQVMMRIIMNKSKYIEDQEFMEKLKELPHLVLELFKL